MKLRRVARYFSAFTVSSAESQPSQTAVAVRDVSKRFRAGRRSISALDGVSFTVDRGEFVSIVGASGSGKSTLLNIISGIDSPDDGNVVVLGRSLAGMSQDALAAWRGKNVGIVFQFFQLMPTLSVRENVILPMDLASNENDRWDRADQLLELVSISHLGDNLPSELSGGEQQRAAIARSLANDPGLLIADEPTGNLDSVNGAAVIDILDELWRGGTTVLMVTHDRDIARRAPRQIRLHDGRIEADERLNPVHDFAAPARVHADAD